MIKGRMLGKSSTRGHRATQLGKAERQADGSIPKTDRLCTGSLGGLTEEGKEG